MTNAEPASIHERQEHKRTVIRDMTELVGGPGANPLEVFPDPSKFEKREDIVWSLGDSLPASTKRELRESVADLEGPGTPYGVTAADLKLKDGEFEVVEEGGLAWKMYGQKLITLGFRAVRAVNPDAPFAPQEGEEGFEYPEDPNAPLVLKQGEYRLPSGIIVSGSTYRMSKEGSDELKFTSRMYGLDKPTSELDIHKLMYQNDDNFTPETDAASDVVNDAYSLKMFGRLGGVPLRELAIGRVYLNKMNFMQLDNTHKLLVAHGIAGQDAAIVSSALYRLTVEESAVAANKQMPEGRKTHVMSYGSHMLALVKGGQPAEATLAQVGAEYHKMALLLR